jgi:hypothetical protein
MMVNKLIKKLLFFSIQLAVELESHEYIDYRFIPFDKGC